MIYAKVYDATVDNDYYKAMAVVERKTSLYTGNIQETKPIPRILPSDLVEYLLHLCDRLSFANVDSSKHQYILNQLRQIIQSTL